MSGPENLPAGGISMLKAMMSKIENKGSHLRDIWTELLSLIAEYQEQLALKETEILSVEKDREGVGVDGKSSSRGGDKYTRQMEEELKKVREELAATHEELIKAAAIRAELETSQQEHQMRLGPMTEELSATKVKLANYENSCEGLEINLRVMSEELVACKTDLKKSANVRAELAATKKELKCVHEERRVAEKVREELRAAQEELRRAENIRQELQLSKEELHASKEVLETNLTVVSEELATSQEELQKAEKAIAELSSRPTREELNKAEHIRGELRASQEELVNNLSAMSAELGASKEKLKNSEKIRSDLEEQLKKAEEMRDALEGYQEELKTSLGVMSEEVIVKDKLIEKLQAELRREAMDTAETGGRPRRGNVFEIQQSNGGASSRNPNGNAPAEYRLVISDIKGMVPGSALPSAEIINMTNETVKIELPNEANFEQVGDQQFFTAPTRAQQGCTCAEAFADMKNDFSTATFGSVEEAETSSVSFATEVEGEGDVDNAVKANGEAPAEQVNADKSPQAPDIEISSTSVDSDIQMEEEEEISCDEEEIGYDLASDDETEPVSDSENDSASDRENDPVSERINDPVSEPENDPASGPENNHASGQDNNLAPGQDKDPASGPENDPASSPENDPPVDQENYPASNRDSVRSSTPDLPPIPSNSRRIASEVPNNTTSKSDVAEISSTMDKISSKSIQLSLPVKAASSTSALTANTSPTNDSNEASEPDNSRFEPVKSLSELRSLGPTADGHSAENKPGEPTVPIASRKDKEVVKKKTPHNTQAHALKVNSGQTRNHKAKGDIDKTKRKKRSEVELIGPSKLGSMTERESIYDLVKSRRTNAKFARTKHTIKQTGDDLSSVKKHVTFAKDGSLFKLSNTQSSSAVTLSNATSNSKTSANASPEKDSPKTPNATLHPVSMTASANTNASLSMPCPMNKKVSPAKDRQTDNVTKSNSRSSETTIVEEATTTNASASNPKPTAGRASPTISNPSDPKAVEPRNGIVRSPVISLKRCDDLLNSQSLRLQNDADKSRGISEAMFDSCEDVNRSTGEGSKPPTGTPTNPKRNNNYSGNPKDSQNGSHREIEVDGDDDGYNLYEETDDDDLDPDYEPIQPNKPKYTFKEPVYLKLNNKPNPHTSHVRPVGEGGSNNKPSPSTSHVRPVGEGGSNNKPKPSTSHVRPVGEGGSNNKPKPSTSHVRPVGEGGSNNKPKSSTSHVRPVGEGCSNNKSKPSTSHVRPVGEGGSNNKPNPSTSNGTFGKGGWIGHSYFVGHNILKAALKRDQTQKYKHIQVKKLPPTDNSSSVGNVTMSRKELTHAQSSVQEKQRNSQIYGCKDCGKVFTCKSSLIQHGLVHTLGESSKDTTQGHGNTTASSLGASMNSKGATGTSSTVAHPTEKESGNSFPVPNGPYYSTGHTSEALQNDPNASSETVKPIASGLDLSNGRSVLGFSCKFCGKVCKMKSILDKHMILHTQETDYKCEYCDQRFTTKSTLTCHRRIHTGEKPFECKFCGMRFIRTTSLNSHLISHSTETPWKCDICGKSFPRKTTLKQHITIIHKREGCRECHVCGKKFIHSSSLHHHLRMHAGIKPHKCDKCGKTYVSKSTLITHLRVHTGERPFECLYCGKRYHSKAYRNNHQKRHRTPAPRPYECKDCGKRFCRLAVLKLHQNKHTGNKPYVCKHCGRKFTNPHVKRRHERIHTGEKEHKCHLCGAEFHRPSSLVAHRLVHSDETPFKCEVCGKAFKRKAVLINHARVHTKEKPCKCQWCKKAFTTRFVLRKHQHREHPEEIAEFEKKEKEIYYASI